jgi:hypothetical protein
MVEKIQGIKACLTKIPHREKQSTPPFYPDSKLPVQLNGGDRAAEMLNPSGGG